LPAFGRLVRLGRPPGADHAAVPEQRSVGRRHEHLRGQPPRGQLGGGASAGGHGR
jgi:hypothetical protein